MGLHPVILTKPEERPGKGRKPNGIQIQKLTPQTLSHRRRYYLLLRYRQNFPVLTAVVTPSNLNYIQLLLSEPETHLGPR